MRKSIKERTAQLIVQYNSYQNPEDVIALMAGEIASLEDENRELQNEIRDAYHQGVREGAYNWEGTGY